jgi:hypothetical protein
VARVDQAILREIVRVVDSRGKVPDRVQIQKRRYEITYLEDHRQRIEETLRRHDSDRLNMLFGQLASKVKYKLVRATQSRRATAKKAPARTPKARTPKAGTTKARTTKKRTSKKRPRSR